jgi:hemerythrin-like domain-containing protein
MQLGYTKDQILGMLDEHLVNLTEDLEKQINKIKETKENSELGLATLISSSMLSLLDAVSAVIEVNNNKLLHDLKSQGLIKDE